MNTNNSSYQAQDYQISLASSFEHDFIFRRFKNTNTNSLKTDSLYANYLIHKIYCLFRKKNRHYTASTKTKSEVRGGGKKPWPQKGRGRARVGSIRSPLWRGGGVCFGPKPKKISIKVNNREYDKALRTLLFFKRDSIIAIGLTKNSQILHKTKQSKSEINLLCQKSQTNRFSDLSKLIVVTKLEYNLLKKSKYLNSLQNLNNISIQKVNDLKFDKILKAGNILLTPCAIHQLDTKNFLWKKY